MGVLSPALVVAMSVMFVLTRLHQHFNLFEVIVFFRLKFCVQPNRNLVQQFLQPSSSSSSNATSATTTTPAPMPRDSAPPKAKLTVSSLPVQRAKISHLFFAAQVDYPYHACVHHVLSLCCAYVCALAFETFMACRFPHVLLNTRSFYVAIFTILYTVYMALRISVFLSSLRVMLLFTAFSALLTLVLLSLADDSSFFRSRIAFDALHHSAFITLRSRLHLPAARALTYASRFVHTMRVLLLTATSVCLACVIVPARRFSLLDFQLRTEFIQDRRDASADPYSLPPPTLPTAVLLTADYALSFVCMAAFVTLPATHSALPSAGWRFALLAVCIALRASLLRLRLQAYLDGAIEAYRKFWQMRASIGIADAFTALTRSVVSTTFYLPMMAMAYLTIILPPALLMAVALMNGLAVVNRPAFCVPPPAGSIHPAAVFVSEFCPFLAWLLLAAYLAFASLSFAVEVLFSAAGISDRGKPVKLPVANRASDRRKLKRLKDQQQPAASPARKR